MLKTDAQFLKAQFNVLELYVSELDSPITMLNVLRGRTKLEHLEPCEIESILKCIETLVEKCKNELENRIEFILNGGNDERK